MSLFPSQAGCCYPAVNTFPSPLAVDSRNNQLCGQCTVYSYLISRMKIFCLCKNGRERYLDRSSDQVVQ